MVDDEESIGFALQRYFQHHGFRVDVAMELEEAQALVADGEYGVVVADLRLSGQHGAEGLELLRYIRQVQPWVRSILLSAYVTEDVERAAKQRGADVVLRKPIALPELGRVVQSLIDAQDDG